MRGKPVVIRTFDLGADKNKEGLDGLVRVAPNPALGLRAVRFCLAEPRLFLTQLRAILRASHYGNVRILIPMLASTAEVDQSLALIAQAKGSLLERSVPFNPAIEVGGMIEIPAAVLTIEPFARRLDFLSIGTNDLIQYTLAVDRTNEKVAGLFCPAHPAVLKLVRDVIRIGQRHNISVSVCGEMAGEPLYTLLLLGLGLTLFSMNGPDIPEVKKIIRSTSMEHARQVARRVMSFDSERQVMHFLREETRKLVPEAF
jgi:phosphotransferase system enzyme I (PtsI)